VKGAITASRPSIPLLMRPEAGARA
jgi:hypothetical protein